MDYDCTADILEHKRKVEYWMRDFTALMTERAKNHDKSKLESPEKEIFDQYTWRLKTTEFGSEEYKAQLTGMGEGLKHHYVANRHHPEHFENGVNGMTLYDLVEMFCDWLAAAQAQSKPIDIEYLSKRFNLSDQLCSIILNTLRDVDFWNEVNGVPCTYFTPEDRRGGQVTIA